MKRKIIIFGLIFLFLCSFAVVAKEIKQVELTTIKQINSPIFDNDKGKIDFLEDINSSKSWAELQKKIKFEKNKVIIDSKTIPELNKPAKITFKDSASLLMPITLYNGIWEPTVIPQRDLFGDWYIYVTHFSSWELTDTDWNGTHNQTTVYSGNILGLEPDAQLILYFDDYDNTTVESVLTDDSNNSISITTTSPNYNSSCKYSGCLKYDGTDDYISAGTSTLVNDIDKLTLSAWVYPTGTTNFRGIVVEGDNVDSGYFFGFNNGNNELRFYINGANDYERSSTQVTANKWTHVAVTYNGTNITLYIDGVEDTGSTTVGTIDPNITIQGKETSVGGDIDRDNYYFIGQIDCVQVWNKTLTANEVKELNNSASCKSIIHHTDDSMGSNDGSCTGTACPSDTTTTKYNDISMEFDGVNDRIDVPNNASLNSATTELTVSTWINALSMPNDGSPTARMIIRHSDGTTSGTTRYYLSYEEDTQLLTWAVGNSSTRKAVTTAFTPNGTWHHIAGIYNSSHILLYLNGALKSNNGLTNTLDTTTQSLYIGKDTGDRPFNGTIECLQIWNKSLSATNVTTLNNSDSCNTNFESPISTWRLNNKKPKNTWDFNSYNKTLTDSNQNRNLDIGPFHQPSGQYNYGVQFDGIDDYINISYNSEYAFSSAMSVSTWAKFLPMADDGSPTARLLVKHSDGFTDGTSRYYLSFNDNTQLLNFVVGNATKKQTLTSDISVNDGNWHHIVGTYDGTDVKLYVNGSLMSSESLGGNLDTSTEPIYIGKDDGDRPFNGSLDNMMLFDRALNLTEIVCLWNNTNCPPAWKNAVFESINLSDGWSITGGDSINNSNTFTTIDTGGAYKNVLTDGQKYRITIDLSTTSSFCQIYDGVSPRTLIGSGSGSWTFTAQQGGNLYFRNADTGATTINSIELIELENTKPIYHYRGNYITETYNYSDYDNNFHTNKWLAVVLDNNNNISKVEGRAGNCTNVTTQPWESGSWNGSHYSFTNQQGKCFQANIYLNSSNSESYTEYNNFTVSSYKVKKPSPPANLQISHTMSITTFTAHGNATFILNDTDTGNLSFEWFFAGVNTYNETISGLTNGTKVTSNFTYNYSDDITNVYFKVRGILNTSYGNANGEYNTSSNTSVTDRPKAQSRSPINGTTYGQTDSVTVEFTPIDYDSTNLSCLVYGDIQTGGPDYNPKILLYNNSNCSNNTVHSFTWYVDEYTHSWLVQLTDDNNVIHNSSVFWFNIQPAAGGGGGGTPRESINEEEDGVPFIASVGGDNITINIEDNNQSFSIDKILDFVKEFTKDKTESLSEKSSTFSKLVDWFDSKNNIIQTGVLIVIAIIALLITITLIRVVWLILKFLFTGGGG